MDAGTVLNGVILVVGALFGILKQLLIYVMSFLYLLVSPLLYLGRGLLSLALLPVRIILKFEAFIYFVTGAVLTGITVGLFLHFAGTSLSQLLRLESTSPPLRRTDLVDPNEPPADWELKWRDQYSPSTILEEEETSQASA